MIGGMDLREECELIVRRAIRRVLPDEAVRRALCELEPGSGRTVLVSVGKAAWSMAKAAWELLGDRISDGIVVTKHG